MRRHNLAETLGQHLDHSRYPDVAVSTAQPMLITSGPMLCRLHVWTDEQWAVLPDAERPAQYTHAPGLGWIGAIPIVCMN
jgi:hypothetical protein